MGEYRHKQPLFPKEIVLVIIAAVVMAGAVMIFGSYLLSAINSGANTVADPNPEIPKAGDTGQLPAVVNETTSAPKQAEKVSDNIRIIGNGLKVERFDSTFQLSELQPGTIHFAEWNLGGGKEQADFYIVVDRNDGAATLKNVVLEFKRTTVKNFAVIDNINGITITAEIAPGSDFIKTASSLTAASEIPFVPKYTFPSLSRNVESPKESQEILGSISGLTEDEKERLSKTKILFLRVTIIA